MQARKWNLDTDYEYLVKWWEQYDFGKVPKECLPPDGVIIEDNGCLLYTSDAADE